MINVFIPDDAITADNPDDIYGFKLMTNNKANTSIHKLQLTNIKYDMQIQPFVTVPDEENER